MWLVILKTVFPKLSVPFCLQYIENKSAVPFFPSQVSVTSIWMRKSFLVAIDLTLTRWISPHQNCALPVSSQWLTPQEPLYLMQWWNAVLLASGCVHIAPHTRKQLVWAGVVLKNMLVTTFDVQNLFTLWVCLWLFTRLITFSLYLETLGCHGDWGSSNHSKGNSS